MNKQAVFVIIGVLLFVLGVAFYSYQQYAGPEESFDKATTADSSIYPANTSQNAQEQTSNLVVQGGNDSNVEKDKQLPLPESFEVYEEYADNTSALFIDIELGTGTEVASGDSVAMIYQGWLTSGELFDQTRVNEEGLLEPFVFQLGGGQVIRGWDQAIAGMKEGGKRRLIIPSSVGYGPAGQGQIPPDAMLIFDVELLAAQKPS